MADPDHPLPNRYLSRGGKERGCIMVSKREFDAWVAAFPPYRGALPTAFQLTNWDFL